MAIKQKVYLFSVNEFKEPSTLIDRQAIALSLMQLILLEPGTDPLHPSMGVGVKKYRFVTQDKIDTLCSEIQSQIQTYLPEYQNATVSVEVTKEKLLNISIAIDDAVYIYDSANSPVPITLNDIQNN